MATLRLRKGVYFVDYRVDGVRRRVSTKTSDKKIAQAILKDYDAKIARANHLGVPFEDLEKVKTSKADSSVPLFFRNFTEHCRQRYAPDNFHSDLARLRSWQEFFARKGVKYLSQISPRLVNEFTTTVLAGKKPKTIKNHMSLLKTALNYAVENDWIEENPIQSMKTPKIPKGQGVQPFEKAEIEKFIAEAQEPLKTGIIILVNTGMRRGELFHLRWRDVDLRHEILRVWPYEDFTPKGKEPRKIPLNDRALETLRSLKRDSEYVFRPYVSIERLGKQFLELVRSLGIKGSLHKLRHTFAAHLAMEGVAIPVIQKLLGHSDIRTTQIYSDFSKAEFEAAAVKKISF